MDLAPIQVESMLLALKMYVENGYSLGGLAEAPEPKGRVKRGPVVAELLLGYDKVRKGSNVPIAVRLTMEKGWHVQAHNPSSDRLSATRFQLDAKGPFELATPIYPKPQKIELDATLKLGNELLVYGGEVLMGGLLKVASEATAGSIRIPIMVEFQACNEKNCLLPEKVLLEVEVEVVEKTSKAQKVNSKIFETMGLYEK